MPKRFGVNYAIMAIVLDYGLTMLSLVIAVALRPILPQIPFFGTSSVHSHTSTFLSWRSITLGFRFPHSFGL